jgi:hypothetical protein
MLERLVTPAEFRCAREFLGLSTQWVAEKLKVDSRDVRTWESGLAEIPAGATEFMQELLAAASQTVGTLTIKWSEQNGDKAIPVPNGEVMPDGEMPARYYRHIASRVAERTQLGIDYGNPTG